MTIEDISLLFVLRIRTVRGIRSDFGDMYSSDQCPLCVDSPHKDTIKALIKCPSLSHTNSNGTEFEDISLTQWTIKERPLIILKYS